MRSFSPVEGSPYLTDESKMTGSADMVYFPENEEDIIEVLGKCDILTISSMRTGVCGGCVPNGGSVLSMEKMNSIVGIGVDENGEFIRCLPAVTVNQIDSFLLSKQYDNIEEITPGAKEHFRNRDLFCPVDPTEMNGSIGGNVATNASGPRTFRYGPTRNRVRGLRVILSDGTLIDIKRGDHVAKNGILRIADRDVILPTYDFRKGIKNATGLMTSEDLDAVDLFIGSEGILGVITRVDVYLIPRYDLVSTIVFFPTDEDAYGFVKDIVSHKEMIEFLEFFDSGSVDLIRSCRKRDPLFVPIPEFPMEHCSAVFFDMANSNVHEKFGIISDLAQLHGSDISKSWCAHEARDRKELFAFRHSVPRAIFDYVASIKGKNPGMHKMGTDMSVPLDNLDEMVAYYHKVLKEHDLEYVMFGHIGNGHLHVEIILKDMDDMQRARHAYSLFAGKAMELGGSPSAEHGIGKIKNEYIEMMYGEKGVEEIRKVKSILDPQWKLNPGNMVVR